VMEDRTIRKPKGLKKKKMLGRGVGSGHGKTSGKGTKGQKARSGGGVRLGFEGGQMPLFRRIARRGFSNAPFKKVYAVINVSELNRFPDGEKVTEETLRARGLLGKKGLPVKILGNGELARKLSVSVDKVSATAREKILAAGGTVDRPGGGAAARPRGGAAAHPRGGEVVEGN
jgi:large subunit ribosomal protein L15